MDAKEVMILITGAHKSFALYKAIEDGVNHMWTVSAFQVLTKVLIDFEEIKVTDQIQFYRCIQQLSSSVMKMQRLN